MSLNIKPYVNIFLVIIILLATAQAQENDPSRCKCDTDEDIKNKNDLWDWLKKLETEDVPDAEKTVTPGYLHQFDCRPCNDEERNSQIMTMVEFEEERRRQTEKAAKKKAEKVPDVETGEEITNPESPGNNVEESDKRCPTGTIWIPAAKTCLPKEDD